MKLTLLSLVPAFALAFSVQAADSTAKISNVHLCCKSCVTAVEKAIAKGSATIPTVTPATRSATKLRGE